MHPRYRGDCHDLYGLKDMCVVGTIENFTTQLLHYRDGSSDRQPVEAEVVQSVQVATAEDSPSVLDINLEHTQGGNQDATAEDPPAAAPRRTPRGRTTTSCETSVAAGNPKPVVKLLDGNPIGPNAKIFKSTVFSWLKTPTVVSQGVTGFSKLTYHDLNNFWNRVKEKLQELANQHMDESGNCTASDQQLLDGVFGPGKKGRERMKGHTAGRKKGTITQEDVQRAVEVVRRENVDQMEALRRENNERLEALRLETVTNMQAAIQAMIAAGQLLVPPTMPRQASEARQDTTEDVEE